MRLAAVLISALVLASAVMAASVTVDRFGRTDESCTDLTRCQNLPIISSDDGGKTCQPQTIEYKGLWHDDMILEVSEDCVSTATPQ